LKDFTRAIEYGPKVERYYLARALIYRELEKVSKACKDFEKACDLDDCDYYDSAVREGVCE